MRSDLVSEFLFDPEVIQFNHASYGTPTRSTMAKVVSLRRELERDPAANLGEHVLQGLHTAANIVRDYLGLGHGELAFTLNTTEAHETVRRSVVAADRSLSIGLRDDEYESIRSSWLANESEDFGSVTVHRGPLHGADLPPQVSISSVVASSTARRADPREAAGSFARIVDASHGPGHIDVEPWLTPATAVVGSLHKWLPAVRPVGFLWLSNEWPLRLRPAITSLRDPAASPLELLSWRGTWDPTPHLAVPHAIQEWKAWQDDGLIWAAEVLADDCSQILGALGLQEWNNPAERAPRMRAFVIPDRSTAAVKDVLRDSRINAWVGQHLGHTIIRLAFNMYNDAGDIDRVADVLKSIGTRT